MTNEDILAIAREIWDTEFDVSGPRTRVLEFARRIQQMERERCAGICEASASPRNDAYSASYVLKNCAAAIREQSDE